MEKLIYPPTGTRVSVEKDVVESMLKAGFTPESSKPVSQPASKPATKKAGKNESKNTKKF